MKEGTDVTAPTAVSTTSVKEIVERESGQKVDNCYQCGKCSAGCPSTFVMDYPPSVIMRLLQLDDPETLRSNTYEVCVSCIVCTVRCPQEIDIQRIMDTMREIAIERGLRPKERKVSLFNRIFVNNIRRYGRLFEPHLVLSFNLTSLQPFKDMLKAPGMLLKGKLGLFPASLKSNRARRIVDRVQKASKGQTTA
jgi:heterodisulfide reductase subunit C